MRKAAVLWRIWRTNATSPTRPMGHGTPCHDTVLSSLTKMFSRGAVARDSPGVGLHPWCPDPVV